MGTIHFFFIIFIIHFQYLSYEPSTCNFILLRLTLMEDNKYILDYHACISSSGYYKKY